MTRANSKPANSKPKAKVKVERRKAAAKAILEGLGPLNLGKLRAVKVPATKTTSNPERMVEIQRLLAIGMTRDEIAAFARQEWDLEEQAVDYALERVRERWARHDAEAQPHLRATYKRSLGVVLQASMVEVAQGGRAAQQHARNALKAIDQLCRIDGVYTPERLIVTSVIPTEAEVKKAADDLADIMRMMEGRPEPDPTTRH